MIHHCCHCHRRRRPSLAVSWRRLNASADGLARSWAALRAQARAEWPPIHRGRLALALGLIALTVLLLTLA